MQTILGSGGAIGIELGKALTEYTSDIRNVSRNPKRVNPTDELFPANLTNPTEVMEAVKGSEVVYLTVGLPYDYKVWQTTWPVIMTNVLEACKKQEARLLFFDNVYMYDPNYLDRMKEDTPMRPVSKKGAVRAELIRMIFEEVERGNIQAVVARSADFYGPSISNTSVLTETVFENLNKGKKAIWLGSVDFKHSFTYTPDAGKATALLGNTPEAYNQVWHLPTAANPYTGRAWIENIASALGAEPRFQAVPKFMLRVIGLFSPVMRNMVEMMYQYQRDYVFNSDKFEQRFDFKPTSYTAGISNIVQADYSEGS